MPSPTRSSSSRKRSAATRIQTRARAKIQGQRTRKQHARSIEQIYRNLEIANQCAICHESMINNGPITKLGCTHTFHSKCVKDILRRGYTTCPMCRTPMTITEIQSLQSPRQQEQPATSQRRQQRQRLIELMEQSEQEWEQRQRQQLRQALYNREHYSNELTRLNRELRLVANDIDTIPSYSQNVTNPHSRASMLAQRVTQIMDERTIVSQNLEEARHAVARLEGIPLPRGF
jgi:hypothetical protein